MTHVWGTPNRVHDEPLTSAYGDQVAEEETETPGARRFANLLKEYRLAGNRTQEFVAAQAGIGLNTLNRWERGIVRNPFPEQVKAVCRVIRLNPVHAWLALGGLDPEDIDLPEAGPPPSPTVEQAIAILEDPRMSDAARFGAMEYLNFLFKKATEQTEMPGTGTQPRAS